MDVEQVPELRFDPADPADADELFPIMSDPAGWWFEPSARHTQPATTRSWLERAAARWSADGLSYWSVRLPTTGELVGVGGVQKHRSGMWNLSYRIAVPHQRRGFALALGRAGLDAAHAAEPDTVVVAWILEANEPSRRVAHRLGLRPLGPRVDVSDGVVRIAHVDRELGPGPGQPEGRGARTRNPVEPVTCR